MATDKVKQLLLSVTKDDCDWVYQASGGPGGQHRNKVATAVTVKHRASGAIGHAADSKSQWQNRQTAWKRMAATSEFQKWLKKEASRAGHSKAEEERMIEEEVRRQMRPSNLKVEIGDGEHWSPE